MVKQLFTTELSVILHWSEHSSAVLPTTLDCSLRTLAVVFQGWLPVGYILALRMPSKALNDYIMSLCFWTQGTPQPRPPCQDLRISPHVYLRGCLPHTHSSVATYEHESPFNIKLCCFSHRFWRFLGLTSMLAWSSAPSHLSPSADLRHHHPSIQNSLPARTRRALLLWTEV